MGGQNAHKTNQRWRTAAILKNRHFSATVTPSGTKFHMIIDI